MCLILVNAFYLPFSSSFTFFFFFFFLFFRNHCNLTMVFFSSLKNLFSRRDKRTSNASSLQQAASKKKGLAYSNGNQHSSNKSTAANSPANSTTNNSSNGHSFQYKDGRRYHGDSDVAYVLPNDDDGNTLYSLMTVLHLNNYLFAFRGRPSSSTTLDSSLCTTEVGIVADHRV